MGAVARIHRSLFLLLLSACLIPVQADAGIWGEFKAWRARRIITQAEARWNPDDEVAAREAWFQARAAHNLAPQLPEVIRVVARFYESVDPESAVTFWREVNRIPETTLSDQIGLIRSLILVGDVASAEEHLQKIHSDQRNKPEVLKMRAIILVSRQRWESAWDIYSALLEAEPSSTDLEVECIRTGIRHSDQEIRTRELERLHRMAGRPTRDGLDALLVLARMWQHGQASAETIMQAILSHPEADTGHVLTAFSLHLRTFARKDTDILSMCHQHLPDGDYSDRVLVGRWMLQHGFPQEADQWVRATEWGSSEAQEVVLGAWIAMGEYQRVFAHLSDRNRLIDEFTSEICLMRASHGAGDPSRVSFHFRRALLSASRESIQLRRLYATCMHLNLLDHADTVIDQWRTFPLEQREALTRRLHLRQMQRDTGGMLATALQIESLNKEDASIVNDVCYLHFLSGLDPGQRMETAKKLVSERPQYLGHRVTLALGLAMSHQMEDALVLFQNLPEISVDQVRVSWRTIIGWIYARNGYIEQARNWAGELSGGTLLPEEVALLDQLHHLVMSQQAAPDPPSP